MIVLALNTEENLTNADFVLIKCCRIFFSSYATKTAAGRLSYDSVFPRTQLLKVRVVIKPDSEFDSLAEINFCFTITYCQRFLSGV